MRALKALVVIMGVIIVIGLAVVGVTIFNRLGKPAPAPVTVAAPTGPATTAPAPTAPAMPSPSNPTLSIGTPLPPLFDRKFGDATVKIPAGARVADFSASGDRLVLRVVMPDQEQRLLVVDLINGTVLGTIRLTSDTTGGTQPSLLTPLPAVNVPPRNKNEGLK
jgi:hypothetical protein